MENILHAKGKIIFELPNITNKHNLQSSWKKTAVVLFNDDLCNLYGWFVLKRYGIKLTYPIRRAHFTVINDKIDFKLYERVSNELKGSKINFKYSTDIRTNGKHWWLRVFSEDAMEIRRAFGLGEPYHSFHITIGHPFERELENSMYTHRNIIRYDTKK